MPTTAITRRSSAPGPLPTARGIMPATKVSVVMRIGRSRSRLPWRIAGVRRAAAAPPLPVQTVDPRGALHPVDPRHAVQPDEAPALPRHVEPPDDVRVPAGLLPLAKLDVVVLVDGNVAEPRHLLL